MCSHSWNFPPLSRFTYATLPNDCGHCNPDTFAASNKCCRGTVHPIKSENEELNFGYTYMWNFTVMRSGGKGEDEEEGTHLCQCQKNASIITFRMPTWKLVRGSAKRPRSVRHISELTQKDGPRRNTCCCQLGKNCQMRNISHHIHTTSAGPRRVKTGEKNRALFID